MNANKTQYIEGDSVTSEQNQEDFASEMNGAARAAKLAEMNELYFVVKEAGKVRVMSFERHTQTVGRAVVVRYIPSFMSFADFANFHCNQSVNVNNGGREMELGAWWLHHPNRLTYTGLVFDPGNPDKVIDGKLNLWRGWGVVPKAGDWSLMREHIRAVMTSSAEMFDYVINWLAWAVQHPDQRAEVTIVFRGGKGTGKGILGNAMCRIFGQHAVHISSADQLIGKFNAHLRDASFLFADEAYWPGQIAAEGNLKRLITEPTLRIEGKGRDSIEVPNYLHALMASNDDWVVPAGERERRYVLNEVSTCHQQDAAWFEPIFKQLDDGGLAAMLFDLLQHDLGDWHPRKLPADCGLADQQALSLSPLDTWWLELLESGTLAGCDPSQPNCARSGDYEEKVNDDDSNFPRHITRPGLFSRARSIEPRLRNHTSDHALGKYLKKQGCISREKKRVLRKTGWEFPELTDCRKAWVKRFPGHQWRDPDLIEWQREDHAGDVRSPRERRDDAYADKVKAEERMAEAEADIARKPMPNTRF
jgi:Family of unknown function (DUF5906)